MSAGQNFYEFSATTPALSASEPGQDISLNKYAGKVVLVENVATL
jgi:glutathione peroxidase-family protein